MGAEKFTKGPWVSDERDGKFLITADRPPMIADPVGVGVIYRGADARLTITAPQMFEALRRLEDGGLLQSLLDMDAAAREEGEDEIAGPAVRLARAALAAAVEEDR